VFSNSRKRVILFGSMAVRALAWRNNCSSLLRKEDAHFFPRHDALKVSKVW
jgi:hypothetical protein